MRRDVKNPRHDWNRGIKRGREKGRGKETGRGRETDRGGIWIGGGNIPLKSEPVHE